MSHIFAITFSTGITALNPDGIKVVKIIPIFKSGDIDTLSLSNYRS